MGRGTPRRRGAEGADRAHERGGREPLRVSGQASGAAHLHFGRSASGGTVASHRLACDANRDAVDADVSTPIPWQPGRARPPRRYFSWPRAIGPAARRDSARASSLPQQFGRSSEDAGRPELPGTTIALPGQPDRPFASLGRGARDRSASRRTVQQRTSRHRRCLSGTGRPDRRLAARLVRPSWVPKGWPRRRSTFDAPGAARGSGDRCTAEKRQAA